MTAPDYEAMAREVFQVAISCEGPGHEPIAAALREADAAALERAAQLMPPGQGYGPDLARRIRAPAQPAPGGRPDARCGYTMTVRLSDFVPLECELPPSHTGPHRNDIAEWTSPPSAPPGKPDAADPTGLHDIAPFGPEAQPAPAPPPTSAVDWRKLLAGVVQEAWWVLGGGDDPRDRCGSCGAAGYGRLRELLRDADTALASPAAEKRAEPEGAGQALRAAYEIGYRDCEVCHDRNPDRVAAPAPKADPREEPGFWRQRYEAAVKMSYQIETDLKTAEERVEAWQHHFAELCDAMFPESVGQPRLTAWKDLQKRATEWAGLLDKSEKQLRVLWDATGDQLIGEGVPEIPALLAKLAARAGRG